MSIRTALEAAGVEFTNGDAPGVRLRAVAKEAMTMDKHDLPNTWADLAPPDQRLLERLVAGGAMFSNADAERLIDLDLAQQGLGGHVLTLRGKSIMKALAAALHNARTNDAGR